MSRLIRFAGVVLGAVLGYTVVLELVKAFDALQPFRVWLIIVGVLLGWLLGSLLSLWLWSLFERAMSWILDRLASFSFRDLILALLGLVAGLLCGFLIGYPLSRVPLIGPFLWPAASLIGGYLGFHILLQRREEIGALPRFDRLRRDRPVRARGNPKLLDTSVIIDGRIADVVKAGFLEGPLLVPRSVLVELQRIADSSDALRRNRGRRGLDILNRMQRELHMVQIVEDMTATEGEVDGQLVALAKEHRGWIVTNDYNLNKVAELQGVRVLNVNELSQALRPVVLPGEELSVHVIKDGKEAGQGVGYLDDGTMVVVEGGRKFMGETFDVIVTSVLQTVAGRMIFGRPKEPHGVPERR